MSWAYESSIAYRRGPRANQVRPCDQAAEFHWEDAERDQTDVPVVGADHVQRSIHQLSAGDDHELV
jgi:hypothetical protein